MWATIIALIATAAASITSTAIRAAKQKKEGARARNEARGLANMERQDVLKQQRVQNRQARKELDLGAKQVAFQQEQADITTQNLEGQKADVQKAYRREAIGSGALFNVNRSVAGRNQNSSLWGV